MKSRILTKTIKKAIKTFPAVVITGPRQSGKTTLLKQEFGKTHTYVSLEDIDKRLRAKEDPLAFLEQYKPPVILDEIQYVPELLSYIKTRIDEDRTPGHWLLSGSQNFVLMENVSQSLAGRAAILTLLPFSLAEQFEYTESSLNVHDWLVSKKKNPTGNKKLDIADWILRGNYPELVSNPSVDRKLWCNSYIATYLERDVRNMTQVGDLNQFERFLKMCAIQTGQILNLSELARDIGISAPTAKQWLSLLEASYQVFLLYPYFNNHGKRIIKSPKLYFSDTALATFLLGIHEAETLYQSPYFGRIFETAIINDCRKRFLNFGDNPSLFYLKTHNGLEVDLVIEESQKVFLFELKSATTIT
ncbi:ATP-binding protein, partial [Candidatus Uhrbacteria bacterium]|nr:ATP-binding protein [Candidatus Uhrbacteria bacterium]